jgi:hypothetical protein
MSVRLSRRGATLPLTIIVIAIMGVAVAISFARLSSERRITGDGQAQLDALQVAQTGLNNYLAGLTTKPGASQDVTINGLPGGSAQISLRMLRESTTTLLPAVYIITSRGTNSTAKRYDSRTPPAERTVATFALWTPAPLDLNGAFTSLTGVGINGNSAHLSGIDRCAGSGMPMIPGVAVPDEQFFPTNPQVVDGNPDNDEQDLGSEGPGGGADQAVDIDWAGIKNGGSIPPDYVWPNYPANAGQWNDWPVIRVNNDGAGEWVIPNGGAGKGILIVTGDLRFNGTNPVGTWEGLILVGGRVRINGDVNVFGAVVSGLNVKLGQIVVDDDLGNGAKTIQYDSCALNRALGQIGSIQRVRNGWTDTWSSY